MLDTVRIGNIVTLFLMGIVLLVINLVIKPFLLLIALPFNLLTFGLFSFVVNALTIMLADGLTPGIQMGGFLNSLLAALIIAVFNSLLLDRHRPSGRRK